VVIGAGFLAGGREALAAEAQVTVSDAGENNAKFEPGTVTVATGGTVTWTNQSSVAVTVTSADGLFDSEEIPPGGSFSQTFDSPGRFRYFCVPLPSMKGTVVVTKN
jgi:plastocyanin